MPYYLIVGNSAAGLAAAEAIRQTGDDREIAIISDEPYRPYSRCLINEVVAEGIGIDAITIRDENYYDNLDITPLLGATVTEIRPQERTVISTAGELRFQRLLVATGARPVAAGVPGDDLSGIYNLRTYNDALKIVESARQSENAVVIGGGLVSLKAATALKKRGIPSVTVVVKSGRIMSRQLDLAAAAILQQALEEQGIKFIFGINPKCFMSDGSEKVSAVVLENGIKLAADLVVVGKGILPNSELIGAAGGQVLHGVVVDKTQRTSLPEIFAAGDVTQMYDCCLESNVHSGLWTLAVCQGQTAGFNMAGENRSTPDMFSIMSSGEFAGIPFVSVGLINPPESKPEWQVLTEHQAKTQTYRRLVFHQNKLTGAVLLGDIDKSGIYTALIRSKVDVAIRRERLLEKDLSVYDLQTLCCQINY